MIIVGEDVGVVDMEVTVEEAMIDTMYLNPRANGSGR